MRNVNLRATIATLLLAVIAFSAAYAQNAAPRPFPGIPSPRVAGTVPPPSLPTIAPRAMPSVLRLLPATLPKIANRALDSRLGPKIPLSMLAPLPKKNPENTLSFKDAGRRRMSAGGASEFYSTVSGCSSTLGYIFNVGCQIEFQLAFCNFNNGSGRCNNPYNSITRTDTFQDYYIDANTATAQTIGATYKPSTEAIPSDCTTQASCSYGPFRNLTLNNVGTVVLATFDTTIGQWVAVSYITVGSANGLQTYADTTRLTPQTQYTIPTAGTTTVYMTLDSAQYSDTYVVYIENTTGYAQCVAVIPGGTSTATLCNPNSVTGIQALTSGGLNLQWTFGIGTSWAALKDGIYSLVAYDQTQNKRVAQTQISLSTVAGGQVSLVPTGGNASPAPAPAGTPTTRFAFDSTSDDSDTSVTQTYSGLTNGHTYCLTITDPQGRVYSDYVGGTVSTSCTATPAGGSIVITHAFTNFNTPLNFASNTYTATACDTNTTPCTIAASTSFQVLGYNALTEFTDTAGTTVSGTSLVVPKNSSVGAGLQFTNDGDTYYGVGNGDTLRAVSYNTGSKGLTIQLSCGAGCTSETVTDSNGQTWNVALTNTGGGANKGTVLDITPATAGQTLAMGAGITLPNLTFVSGPGSATCTSGACTGPTSVLPTDGLTWSTGTQSASSNLTYFTNSNGVTYGGTATMLHLGVTTTGSGFAGGASINEEEHGYYPRAQNFITVGSTNYSESQALYAINEPFNVVTGKSDVYEMHATNGSTSGTITGIAVSLPNSYSTGSYATTWSVDPNSPTKWQQDASCAVTGANFCIKPLGANTGIAIGSSQDIWIDITNLPPLSFTYGDFSVQVYNPTAYTMTADPAYPQTVLVSSTAPTQTTVDSLSLAAYSLDSAYMTPLFNPTSEGTSTNNTVQLSLTNTSTAQDTNPDYVDAVVFELPSGDATPGSFGSITSNWSYLGSTSGLAPSTTDYWFGLCAAQFVTADGPVQNPPPVNPSLTACTSLQEQSSVAPGGTFSFTSPIQTAATAGTITGTVYAHGTNGNGWSKGHSFTLNVSAVSATAGYLKVGTYNSPSNVPANSTPQIGADSNTTFGNSFVYEIANTGSGANNISSATIVLPWWDDSASDGADSSGAIWSITNTPTLSGSGYTNCGVTSFTSPTAGTTAGTIVIGNSGGACKLSPNGKIDVSFAMKGPYKVNDSYTFPTCVNGAATVAGTTVTCAGVKASEAWVGDTHIQTVLGAQVLVTVWPSSNVHGYTFSPACSPATCTFSQPTETLNFGNVANGSTTTGTSVVLVDVYTNAANPITWGLYVSTNSNPANTAGPSNELLTEAQPLAANKSYTPVAGLTIDQTSYAAIPTTGNGLELANGATSATRNPFEILTDAEISINGGPVTAQTSTVTYTFIAN